MKYERSVQPVKSARRALDVLELLTARERSLTFPEIGDALGLPGSSLHALLATLTDAGWLEFDPDSRQYGLGLRVLEAGNAYSRSVSLIDRALPVMTEIRDAIDETLIVAVLDGRHNVYVAKVSGNQLLGLASEVGRRLPAHATGLGKVLLAGLPGAKLSALLDGVELERYTDRTLTSHRALAQALADIRAKGFGEDAEEYTVGVRCVAVPVFDQRGATVAAISVSVPIIRFDETHRKRALNLLRDGAERLSASLGFRVPTHA